jgi:pimeloyl-ACP methyl ester carboxylesterase
VADLPNIVLVHGAWADGSCWSGVIRNLQADSFDVVAPQFPHTSLADNVARLRQVLARLQGPTVIAGHSYGGQIVTALGDELPNVKALVYVAAFGLDEGESIGGLLAQGESPAALAHLIIDDSGYAWLPQEDFVNHFAPDVAPADANVMYAVQQPLAAATLGDEMGVPAWKQVPTWYVVAQNDEAIPPDAERLFASRMRATTTELPSSHVVMTSHPDEVADVIKQAANA